MELLFLGSSNGLSNDTENFQSNMVLMASNGKKLLIDCGTDIRFSLARAQLTPDDIDAIYISHLHADHAGGLEWLGLNRRFISHQPKPELLIHHRLEQSLWKNSLAGGMDTLKEEKASLNSYFTVKTLEEDKAIVWEGISLTLIKTIHMYSNNRLKPSYGLLLGQKQKSFLITTDTKHDPKYFMPYYQQAELIFHDCETSNYTSGVHAHFEELIMLPDEIKAKMWLYHYSDGELPNAQAAGFLGFVKRGQRIKLL